MKAVLLGGLAAAFLGGCAREAPVEDGNAAVAVGEGQATVAEPASPPPRSPDRAADETFTSLDRATCTLIARNDEEAGYSKHRCPGAGGYQVELTESDLRQGVALIRPDGTANPIDLNALSGSGGFSEVGKTAEWRGPDRNNLRALIVRFAVNESPDPAVPPRSQLIVIRTAAPACAVARVDPGPRQNEQARAIADRARLPACLAS